MNGSLTFRPIRPDDEEFLYRVYAGTRADEMALVDWSDEQKEAFIRMQFHAQRVAYQDSYADAEFLIISSNEHPVGRLYILRQETNIHIIDIALLPESRNRGIGSAILKDILADGARTGKPVTIHVEMFNPALRLYHRLGFKKTGEHGVYYFMKWEPPVAAVPG
jgi:ribosomal protein S18 acetylase RimI-like enzyme